MFTGIVQAIGHIAAIETSGGDAHVRIASGGLPLADVRIGDSIAVSGACLTAVALSADGFVADVSAETLACTTLGRLAVGTRVNLEKSLVLNAPLGGHLVSGHVDGVGTVTARRPTARSVVLRIAVPGELARYVARKGSICVDGVSLTVNVIDGREFEVSVVPHTLQATTLGDLTPGAGVNVEIDVVARYLERLLKN